MNLIGANPQASVTGMDQLPGTSNYLIGNDPSQWHAGIANYGQVAYQDVYPGVNLLYYGNQQQLEYDFVVAAGADPGSIRFDIQGADSITLDEQGNLVLATPSGDVLEHAPVIYQEVDGFRASVAGQFVLLGQDEIGFQIGTYDAGLPLTIDPVLAYSTYLGGSGQDSGQAIAVDAPRATRTLQDSRAVHQIPHDDRLIEDQCKLQPRRLRGEAQRRRHGPCLQHLPRRQQR